MSFFKCKMCGGTIEFNQGDTVGVCDSCGTKQSLPVGLDDEKRANLYDRANHFRRNNEYDKAMSIYEQILNEDSKDAEAYWSIILCRYGIEYVEDPTTHTRVPTVNRVQFSSVVSDKDYKSALKYGTVEQKEIYKAEARKIDKIQKGILEISSKEEPFDIFICYKETDNSGRRTPDSVLANDLYHQLTQEGYKVFFQELLLRISSARSMSHTYLRHSTVQRLWSCLAQSPNISMLYGSGMNGADILHLSKTVKRKCSFLHTRTWILMICLRSFHIFRHRICQSLDLCKISFVE